MMKEILNNEWWIMNDERKMNNEWWMMGDERNNE